MTQRPILLDIPDSFESARLILRAPRPGDGAALNAGVVESLEELRLWMPWAASAPTVADSEAVVRGAAAKWLKREDFMLLLWRKDTGELVGGSGMHRIDWAVPTVEIGYWVRSSMAGHGYCTEAVSALVDFARRELGAARLEICSDPRNLRSRKVAERCGFVLEGIHRRNMRDPLGGLRDSCMYARVFE